MNLQLHDLDHQRSCLEVDNTCLRADLQELKADTSTLAQVIQRAQHSHGFDLLERRKAVLLLQKLEPETAQITSIDVIDDAHSRLGVERWEAAASDVEARMAAEVLAEVGNPKAKQANRPKEQGQERIVGRVVNSQIQSEVEVSSLTSRVEQLRLQRAKARNCSTNSTSQVREERMQQLQLEMTSPHVAQECLRKTPAVKKQHTSQEHSHTLQNLQT
ncbi:uncharacterized protein LOC111191774 [Astyanax mexicanus]|uniref:uncharacterized protein LOC111191774 n=1 Tax=Astyanax mexicanus TaxID=7994 RepID=UPI0020CAC1AA|nr:uncharacterized protein LOC111191774 [Astyanax mexicanus]